MSTVSYNSKKIQPAPLVALTKNYQKTSDGELVGSLFTFTIRGTLVSFKGSPTSSGTFNVGAGDLPDETIVDNSRLASLLRKQEAIRELFSQEGFSLEWQSADGSAPMKCNPRINSINFEEGLWYDRTEYTIDCEADIVYVNGANISEDGFTEFISSATENWVTETNEQAENEDIPRTYRVSHTVSAVGKRFYDDTGVLEKDAWKQAQDFVLPKLGFDSTIALASGVINLPDYYQGLNHIRSQNVDKKGGGFSVTETWILTSGTSLEDFTVTSNESVSDGRKVATVNGTITGLEERTNDLGLTTSKIDNAETRFTTVQGLLLNRASTHSGFTLNSVPVSNSTGRNITNGVINYTFEFDDRPGNIVTDTVSEVISVTNSFEVDLFAAVGVLGRATGPVLQDLNSKRETTRSLNIELIFDSDYYGTGIVDATIINAFNPRLHAPQAAELQAIVDAADPVKVAALNNDGVAATTQFISEQNETWQASLRRYSRNISWTYE